MEHMLFPLKEKGAFWKQVDTELKMLEKELKGKEPDEQSRLRTV